MVVKTPVSLVCASIKTTLDCADAVASDQFEEDPPQAVCSLASKCGLTRIAEEFAAFSQTLVELKSQS